MNQHLQIKKLPFHTHTKWTNADVFIKQLKQMPANTLLLHGESLLKIHPELDIFSLFNKKIQTVKIEKEPSYKSISQLRELFSPSCIVAVGGGAVMDTAKLLSIETSNDIPLKMHLNIPGQKPRTCQRRCKLFFFPTNPTSSSHCSKSAVVTYNQFKFSCFGDALKPDMVYADPDTMKHLSNELLLCQCVDPFCHALEILASTNHKENPLRHETLKGWFKEFFKAVQTRDFHTLFFLCSFLFQDWFLMESCYWPIHTLSHALGAKIEAGHAKCLQILLPYFLSSSHWKYQCEESVFSDCRDFFQKNLAKSETIDPEILKASIQIATQNSFSQFSETEPAHSIYEKILDISSV